MILNLYNNIDILNKGHLHFINFISMTKEITIKAIPDFFDGVRLKDIDKEVKKGLSKMIIPTKHPHIPIAPNFFLEVKAPKGGIDVAL